MSLQDKPDNTCCVLGVCMKCTWGNCVMCTVNVHHETTNNYSYLIVNLCDIVPDSVSNMLFLLCDI